MRPPAAASWVSLVLACLTGAHTDARHMTSSDLVGLRTVSAPVLAPTGNRVLYLLQEPDGDPAVISHELTTGERLLVAPDIRGKHAAVWSADGTSIYFLAPYRSVTQLWRARAPAAGAPSALDMPVVLTSLDVDILGFRVTSDSRRLIFWADVFPECDAVLSCTARKQDLVATTASPARIYESLFVRHWDQWDDDRRLTLFSASLTADGEIEGPPLAVSVAARSDSPVSPWANPSDIAVSRDWIFFVARAGGSREAWQLDLDIWSVPANGSEVATNITDDNPAIDTHPAISPDGSALAYLATIRPGHEADRHQLRLRDLSSGSTRTIAPDWDRSIESFAFASDGRSIVAQARHEGVSALFRIDLDTGSVRQITHRGNVTAYDVGQEFVVAAIDSFSEPGDLYVHDARGERRITSVNADRLASVDMAQPQRFVFEGWNSEEVHGVAFKPVTSAARERYPVAFLIHGGPQSSYWDRWDARWLPQMFTARGIAVVAIDFHGSVGYGQAFTDSISGDWGGKPLEDLQRGLKAALARFSWLDGERVCALGWSYGGYMVNWIASQWPEQFRCLVNHAGILDNRMMYFGTEELWFNEWEFGGPYFENPAGHERQNPVHHVDKWKTPMLVLHGGLDYRVPDLQGVATFTALQRQGIPSRFVWFPDEGHSVSSPANRVLWWREVLDWLDRWIGRESWRDRGPTP